MEAERDALVAELVAAAGLGGRTGPVGSTAERSRVAVRKSTATALARIEAHDALLARLLRDVIRTGVTYTFEPDPARPLAWTFHAGSRTSTADSIVPVTPPGFAQLTESIVCHFSRRASVRP